MSVGKLLTGRNETHDTDATSSWASGQIWDLVGSQTFPWRAIEKVNFHSMRPVLDIIEPRFNSLLTCIGH